MSDDVASDEKAKEVKKSQRRRSLAVTNNEFSNSTKLSSVTWDVFSPPPKNSVKGKLVPTSLNRYSQRRKLSVEVHRLEYDESLHHEECVVRVLAPSSKSLEKQKIKDALGKMQKVSEVMSSKPVKDTDDLSIVTGMAGGMLSDTRGGEDFDGWKPKYRIPVDSITVQKQLSNSVTVLIEIEKLLTQDRELIFDTEEEAEDFCEILEKEKKLERERMQAKLERSLGGIKIPRHETISLLIEIVSAWDITSGDQSGTSDPFVVCMLGTDQVHKTDPVYYTLEPIWTITKGSLFILTVDSLDLFQKGGLTFFVEDADTFSKDDLLGLVKVAPATLYKANGERMEFKLNTKGYLALRCRRATERDKEFMSEYKKSQHAIAHEDQPKSTHNGLKSLVARKSKKEDGVTKYKIRPFPDPLRKEETEWMTNEAMKAELEKPSRHWVDTGRGDLGKVHIEILECIGLPNLDVGGLLGNKTDAFVSLVHEDAYALTETISDCLSPKWLPWTRRAFTFRITHPSSQIFVGVFDNDTGMSNHDLVGRVSIDITNLKKDVEYMLSYNLYPSARVEGRESKGVIRVRLRIEIPDERRFVLSAVEPPPTCYLNAKDKKTWLVLRQTSIGIYDYEKFNFAQLQSYIDELRSYQYVTFYLQDGLSSLLFWRGHFPVQIDSKTVLLPLNSFVAFVLTAIVIENPQLFPSYFFLVIAWVLLAVMDWRNRSPNVWGKCISYMEIAQKLYSGKAHSQFKGIEPFERWTETKTEMQTFIGRLRKSEIEAEKAEAKAELDKKRAKEEKKDVETKAQGGSLPGDPVAIGLLPVQLALGIFIRFMRFIKNVVIWDEAYFTFWLVSCCLFLSVACFFVPWFWLIRWTARLVVWTLLGPWMKLVDILFIRQSSQEKADDVESTAVADTKKEGAKRSAGFERTQSELRLKQENEIKLKKMKDYMFGKFSAQIPIIKQDRYQDVPLPESRAIPYHIKERTFAELAMEEAGYNRTRLPGQFLVGDMIPRIESQTFTIAPTGQAILNQSLLSPRSLGHGLRVPGSTASAYAQIGSIVVVAGLVSIFGVPLLAMGTEYFLSSFPFSK